MAFGMRGEPGSSSAMAETPSHFFKVILASTLADKKLRIPEKFVRKFGDELSAVVTLTVPNGQAWHVALTKDGKKLWFNDGWHEFVNYYSICAGHFLVFRYGKKSNFHVLIFDPTACEIQYPYHCGGPKSVEQNLVHHDEMKTNNSFELKRQKSSFDPALGINRTRTCGTPFENNPVSSTQDEHEEEAKVRSRFYGSTSVRKKTVMTDERNRAMAAAKAFKPTNPFCRVLMQPSFLSRKSIMCLPSSFSEKHLHGVLGFIKLQLSDGKQWPVHCLYIRLRHRAVLSQGWHRFILENNIGEGDVCVFEVLRSRDIVLKVTVFHILESEQFVKRLFSGSSSTLRSNRFQKSVASIESPKFKHGIEKGSKKCKIEELEHVIGDEIELAKARHEVEAHSSDEENERTKFHEPGLLALLEDMGIFVSRTFRNIAAEERERAAAAARLFKPKNPSFMVILQSNNLRACRLFVPLNFARKYLSRNYKSIKLLDAEGREWPSMTIWYGRNCCIKGLSGLFRENNLDEGDICIFELIRMKEFLKVSVFHASTE